MPSGYDHPDKLRGDRRWRRDTAGSCDGSVSKIAACHNKTRAVAECRARLHADLLDDIEELGQRLFDNLVHLHVIKAEGENVGESVRETVLRHQLSAYR